MSNEVLNNIENESLQNWKGFDITESIRQGLIAKDKTAIDTFYINNYDKFRAMAFTYLRSHKNCISTLDDLVDQLYLDLPYLNYSSCNYFVYRVYEHSFRHCSHGGYAYLVETNSKYKDCSYSNIYSMCFDRPVDGDSNTTVGEMFCSRMQASCVEYANAIAEEKFINKLLDFLKSILNSKELRYIKMYLEGYSPEYARREVGYTCSHSICDIYIKLRLNYDKILNFLDNNGIDISYYKSLVPDKLEEYKARKALKLERVKARQQDPEVKLRRREICLRSYYKRKAERQAQGV